MTTVPDSELEVPASSGPSGDFEIREEEETTRPDLRNEVVAVVTPPAGPGPGRNVETGLMDNTIDSGNSAAQLPQKNILERKEVLIGEIWDQGFGGQGLGTQGDGLSQERGQARGGHWDNPHPPPKLLRGVSVSLPGKFCTISLHRGGSPGKKNGILVQRFFLESQSCAVVTRPLLRGCSQISKAQNQMIPPKLFVLEARLGQGVALTGRGGTDVHGGGTDSRG